MATRSGAYKMPSLKFADSKQARAKRVEEQNGIRRTARQAQSNAKRGITEAEQIPAGKDQPDVEIPHDQKLRERLAKLKAYREQKIANEQKAKACKKQPFVVPGIARPEATKKEELKQPPAKAAPQPSTRVTRSQAKKGPENESKQWTVTSIKPAAKQPPKKLTKPDQKPATATKIHPSDLPNKPVIKSFAPANFIFSAPKDIAEKSMALTEPPPPAPKLDDPSPASSKAADTPQRSAGPKEDVKISPLLMNNPWITTHRGSSSKKERQRQSLAATPKTSPSEDNVQSSPYLKRRAGSLINTPVNREALHFRSLMSSEGSRLTDLCSSWDELLENGDVPEEESGSVRTVIGQAQLLQRERFNQFAGLINQFENKSGEKEITPTDLEGFWEMIYLQVSDVDKKFEELSKLKANGWVKVEEETTRAARKPRAAAAAAAAKKKPPAGVAAKSSSMRAFIMAARKNQMANKSPGSPSVRRRSSSLLMRSPMMTPSKRQSLRRSVLINSAKKPVFVVTDLSPRTPESRPPALNLDMNEGEEEGASDGLPSSPTVHVKATPKKTYGRTPSRVDPVAVSPEERLSEAFDALKKSREEEEEGESTRKNSGDDEKVSEAGSLTPRRSTRLLRNNNVERVSLLPVATISPVVPQDDLMAFD